MSKKPRAKADVNDAFRAIAQMKPPPDAGGADPMPCVNTYPMSPQEAHQMGTLQAQQAALNAAFDALGAQACARLGLAIGTKLHADPQRGVYAVGG